MIIRPRVVVALLLAGASLACFSGCEVDSADDVQRNVGVNFTGFYQNGDGTIVVRNSGAPITTLDLRQTGDRLEAIDNNGLIFKGSIGGVNESEDGNLIASFQMEGPTTAGNRGTFSGTLSTSGGSNEAGIAVGLMTGTWIEDAFFSTFTGRARIPGAASGGDGGGGDLTITGPSSIAVGGSGSFSVSGGSGSVTWSVSGPGTLTSQSSSSATVRRDSNGTITVSASDGSGNSDSVTVN